MFSMEQLNKAANAATVNKRYRYPQQPMPSTMMTQSGQNYPAYGNTNTSYGMTNPQVQPQQYPPYPSAGNPQFNPGGIPSGNFGIQQPSLPQNYNYNSNQNQYPYSANVQTPYTNTNSQPSNPSPFTSSNNNAIGIDSQSLGNANARPAAPGFAINNNPMNQPMPGFNYGNGPPQPNSYPQQY